MVNENILEEIKFWFIQAKPDPTIDSVRVQLGVHFEEVAEMMQALNMPESKNTKQVATELKTGTYKGIPDYEKIDRKELLDALCDQIVTAVGVAHMYDLDILGAIKEVNRSNWSKFVDGKAQFDENGKILKGPNYTKPDLSNMY